MDGLLIPGNLKDRKPSHSLNQRVRQRESISMRLPFSPRLIPGRSYIYPEVTSVLWVPGAGVLRRCSQEEQRGRRPGLCIEEGFLKYFSN